MNIPCMRKYSGDKLNDFPNELNASWVAVLNVHFEMKHVLYAH
jgi:hypothetical protein